MGPRSGGPVARLQAGRTWLRSRGPVTLSAALLLEISSATAQAGPKPRGLLGAALLVVVLFVVLIAAALDAVVSRAVTRVAAGAAAASLWLRESVLGYALPRAIPDNALLDRAGKPLRGGARSARVAMLAREHARAVRLRSLRGRLEVALARASQLAAPYARRVGQPGLALESRALAARAAALSEARAAAAWFGPRARAAAALGRSRATLLWTSAAARITPRLDAARRSARLLRARLALESAALGRRAVPALAVAAGASMAALGRLQAPLARIPAPAIPFPSLSLRTVRVVTVGLLMSFVFATVIGTTGLVATRGTVALGASTTLAIISGEVSVADAGGEFYAAVDGQILQAGMSVRTGADSYAVLTYFEGSTVSMDPETVLVIEALQANPDGSTVIGMRQDVGRTWHAVTKLLTNGSKYEVRTPNATATVRGTLFLVGVLPASDLGLPETLIETTEGAVAAERAATPETPQGEEIIVPAGFQVKARATETIPPPVPAPEPERKITVTVGAANSLVVDPQGRANGEKDGRIVVQTPGATVERVDGKIVVTLPNTSDGKISTVVPPSEPADDGAEPPAPVQITTVVQERGKGEVRSEETVQQTREAPAATGVEVRKSTDETAPPDIRKLDEDEKKGAPKVKVGEVPAAEVLALERRGEREGESGARGSSGERSGERASGGDAAESAPPAASPAAASPKGIVNAIVTLTLPPLSKEELAKREEEKRKADEQARRDEQRREEERRDEERRKLEELRRAEEQARANASRLGSERVREETRRDERRDEQREQREQAPTPTPASVIEQIVRAITPDSDRSRRDEDKKIEDLRKAEEKAKEEARKAEDERRKAEEKQRADLIKAEEEKKKEAEKRAEELRKAEQKAKDEAAKRAEDVRKIEEKAREQAAKLAEEQRKQAEKLLEEFRKSEEKAREQAAKHLEEQRKAEERAREDAERRLRELRREEEQARERERERERQREEERRQDRRGGFTPTETLRPLPGAGSRSVEEEQRGEQRQEQQERSRASGDGKAARGNGAD